MECRVLSHDQMARIHEASLDILERVGVIVPHEDTLSRFADAGAKVDRDSQRVQIAEGLLDDCIARAGRRFTIYGRDASRTAAFGVGSRNYNSIGGEAHWVDEPAHPRRPARLADVATAARFCEALNNINVVGAMADPEDVPVAVRCVEVLAQQLRHTTKPVHFWLHDRASARYLVELMVALRGSEKAAAKQPPCYAFLEPISPLRFAFRGIDLLYETARLGLPVSVGPMAQMGLSAPCTVAGTLAQENAEILAGICLVQLIQPGAPVCYGGICHAFDMRTTQMIFSGPEQAIFGVALAQMGRHYGLPVYINVGLTDSKRPDAQAGLEIAATLMLGTGAGADIFGHMGIAGVDQATSLDMLVLQDEIIGYVESVLRPVELSDELLGLDVIEAVGPGGTFIDTEHTLRHFRHELWFPRLLDREYYDAWLSAGARSTEQRCVERKREILATSTVPPLDHNVDRAFDDVLSAAWRELVGCGRPKTAGP